MSEDDDDSVTVDELSDDLGLDDVVTDIDSESSDDPTDTRTRKKKAPLDKDKQNRTIFIGNIPLQKTEKEIKNAFKDYGTVESLRFRSLPVDPNAKISKKASAIRGNFIEGSKFKNCYIVFTTADEANKAINAFQDGDNRDALGGRHVRVTPANYKNIDYKHSLFVGGLPYDVTEDELMGWFSNCGEVNSIRVVRDKITRKGKGFGFVSFSDDVSVIAAQALDGTTMRGQTLRVVPAMHPKKAGKEKKRKEIEKSKKQQKKSNKVKNRDEVMKEKKEKKKKDKRIVRRAKEKGLPNPLLKGSQHVSKDQQGNQEDNEDNYGISMKKMKRKRRRDEERFNEQQGNTNDNEDKDDDNSSKGNKKRRLNENVSVERDNKEQMKGNVDQLSFQGVRAKKGEKTASGSQIGGAEAIGLSKSQKKHQKSAKKIIVPGKKTKKEKKVKREKKEKKFEKKEKKIHANKPRK